MVGRTGDASPVSPAVATPLVTGKNILAPRLAHRVQSLSFVHQPVHVHHSCTANRDIKNEHLLQLCGTISLSGYQKLLQHMKLWMKFVYAEYTAE